MTETYTHNCIKCKEQYKDADPDNYYCPSCTEQKKAIAKEIDAKIRPSKQVKSDLQVYDETRNKIGGRFISAKVLGI